MFERHGCFAGFSLRARAAALAAQGLPNQLHGDDLALAPGPPDETLRFRYSFVLPAQACVCTDIDLRQCERYKFDSGVLGNSQIFSENTFESSRLLVFVSLGEDKWRVLLS